MKTIVVAWADETGSRPTGRFRDRYGMEPIYEPAWVGSAVVWANEGGPEERAKAERYLATIDAPRKAIYEFDPREPEPLKKAREAILAPVPVPAVKAKRAPRKPRATNPAPYATLDSASFARFLNDIGAIRPGAAWTKADEGRINMALIHAQQLAEAQGKSIFSGGNAFGAESRGAAESAIEGDPGWARIVVQGLFSMVVRAAPIFDREGRVAYEKRVNPFLKVAARLKWFFK